MEMSPIEIEAAIQTAKHYALRQGVVSDNLDSVAAVMVAVQYASSFKPQNISPTTNGDGLGFEETFAEWASNYALSSHIDRFLAASVFLREKKGLRTVNVALIGEMYDKARWDKPKNLADVFGKAAERMFFTEGEVNDEQTHLKAWQVTRTGYDYFQSTKGKSEDGQQKATKVAKKQALA
jgi:hypothetical protein